VRLWVLRVWAVVRRGEGSFSDVEEVFVVDRESADCWRREERMFWVVL